MGLGDLAGSGVHKGPCRVWGPWRILPGLGVFISAVSTPSPVGDRLPPKAAGSGQPLWGRAPSLSEPHFPLGGVPKTPGRQGAGGTVPHAGAWVQPSRAPMQASVGESSGLGVAPLPPFPDSGFSCGPCTPAGAESRRGLVLTTASAPLPPTELDFWDRFDD